MADEQNNFTYNALDGQDFQRGRGSAQIDFGNNDQLENDIKMDAPLALGSLYGPTKSRKTTHTLEGKYT